MRSRIFKSGNSQAVRIPAEIAYASDISVEVVRTGDTLVVRPSLDAGSLKDAMARLQELPKPTTPWFAERTEVPERDWNI